MKTTAPRILIFSDTDHSNFRVLGLARLPELPLAWAKHNLFCNTAFQLR